METLQDFTNTIAWSGSRQAQMQCQQKSACGKSTQQLLLLSVASMITWCIMNLNQVM